MVTRRAAAALLAVLLAGAAAAGEGVRGRVAAAGVLVEDVEVRAYAYAAGSFGPLTRAAPAAVVRSGTDGTYELALPPGRYVLEALKKAAGNAAPRPETGDLHCLYSGSPVSVVRGAFTAVGFNLVEVPAEQRRKSDKAGLAGRITFKGETVEKVYLYVYDEVGTAFHGPARVLQPVATGSFRLRVPPGTYYLVARKRVRGGAYGPIEIGDLFNFYPRNPVSVGAGEEVSLEVPLIERLSQLEEDPAAFQGVHVKVVDTAGRPAAGYYVLAYRSADRSGPPLAASSRTDRDGKARLPLAAEATVYLRARRSLGGPLDKGESYGDATASGGAGELTVRLRNSP